MERFGKFLLYFVYLAITWDMGCFQQYCGGGLKFSPHDHLNIARNCIVDFDCQSPVKCVLVILYNEVNSSGDPKELDRKTCAVANETSLLKCPKNFSSDSYAYCKAFSSNGTQTNSTDTQIIVFDHLDEVQNMHKNDTDCIVWTTPPNTSDIKLQYIIEFMYDNGKIINSTTSNLTEYCLATFDKCELICISVVAKAVCGDASSNLQWWNGTILKPLKIPWSRFNVSLVMVENGVTIDISYTNKKTCPSVRALSAELSCWYEMKHNETYNYQLTAIQHGEHVQLVHYNNESVVLFPNEITKCNMTLCNKAGQTKQWIEVRFSTFPVQEFNFSKVNKTHICMKYQFLNGSTFMADCRVTLNDTTKIELNGSKNEECVNHSLPSGVCHYCVSCCSDYCIIEGSVNVINGGSTSGNHVINALLIVVGVIAGVAGAIVIVVGVVLIVICVIVICNRKKKKNNFNVPTVPKNETIQTDGNDVGNDDDYLAEDIEVNESSNGRTTTVTSEHLSKYQSIHHYNEDAQNNSGKNQVFQASDRRSSKTERPTSESQYKKDSNNSAEPLLQKQLV